ncbi:hypothetical protein OUZ56_024632 [Daphnia magna]|uniref:Reverse transcriptase RNase H-like domain-containing protein n=1 Tax=Daphnia magna TaxID=35525 RepID=A0ABR0B190_9CRUS|nr:hypothetical protein OUZ56_024625 [Daphnia magna]KAK4031106.1 hypothetical protein OUZ56_024632 [Daphnia magna]
MYSGNSDHKLVPGHFQPRPLNKITIKDRPILSYPDFTREFFIYTDASGYGVETVLAQIQSPPQSEDSAETNESDLSVSDGFEVVISYTSKHLKDREAKWSTTEKEAYAIDIPIRTQIHSFYRSHAFRMVMSKTNRQVD